MANPLRDVPGESKASELQRKRDIYNLGSLKPVLYDVLSHSSSCPTLRISVHRRQAFQFIIFKLGEITKNN